MPAKFRPSASALAVLLAMCLPALLSSQRLSIAFYNVENLFDTLDAPLVLDDDFTPAGNLHWNTERYLTKLDRIAEVIDAMGRPAMVGLAEVENRQVLEDLLKQQRMRKNHYRIVHTDSPDARGIDVALIYDARRFKLLAWDTLRINFPDSLKTNPNLKYTTRDVLFAKFRTRRGAPRRTLWVGVVHAPSRSGGVEATEPLRKFVTAQVRLRIEQLRSQDATAAILLMGDFNDEPNSPSIRNQLHAVCPGDTLLANALYNLTCSAFAAGRGSYNYRGKWNMLDQFIASGAMLNCWTEWTAEPFHFERMMFEHDRFGMMPNRTYGGPNYYGGYSDHLPILLMATWKK